MSAIETPQERALREIEKFRITHPDVIEEAKAIRNIRDEGWSVEEIANFMECSKEYVYRRLRLLDLHEDARDALREGNISMSTAIMLTRINQKDQSEALRFVVWMTSKAISLKERKALELLAQESLKSITGEEAA